jgi:zinc protease
MSLHKTTDSLFLLESSDRLPLISLSMVFRTGGVTDPQGKDGLFRLMLRAMRRGAGTRSSSAFETALDAIGSEVSLEVYTSSAVLQAQVVSRNLEKLMALLNDMLTKPAFDVSELRKLKEESVSELVELRDNDRELSNLAFRRGIFANHPFERLAAGRISALNTLTQKDVAEAHQTLVTKRGVFFGFTGDISEARAHVAVEALMAGVPLGHSGDATLPEPAARKGRHLVFVDKPERSQTQVLIGRLGTHPHDADHVPLTLANAAFGGTFTARLMKEVRSKRGWSYGAYSRLNIERARHSFTLWTFPAADTAAKCIGLELSLLQKFYDQGITERELSFFKKYLARSYAFDIDTPSKRISQELDVISLGLPEGYYQDYRTNVGAVTLAEANQAVRTRLDPSDLVIAVVGTKDTLLADIEKSIPNLTSTTIVDFEAD